MPTWLAGRASRSRARGRRGITLLEMLIVVGLVSLLAGVSFPSISAGLDSLRLKSATNSIVSFLNAGLNRADRRQQVVEVEISKADNSLSMRSTEPGFLRRLQLPEGVTITSVLPPLPQPADGPRRFLLYPGANIPRFGVEINNSRGAHRIIRLDPITGSPQIEQPGS